MENKINNKKYPLLKDQFLQQKIASKKEFQFLYDNKKVDINKIDLCKNSKFVLSPHQEFVKNFMNYNTPYNGLLLYHGMGSGENV